MAGIEKLLEASRRELLDLSTRNRLISMPAPTSTSARVVHVLDEKSDHVFRLLVGEKKSMGFLPGVEEEKGAAAKKEAEARGAAAAAPPATDIATLPQPDEAIDASTGAARRHVDTKLQTALTSTALQRRLLSLYRDARTIMDEQGVNILYLALGRLTWFAADKADVPRHAPLLLVPVELHRRSASDRLTVAWREDDVQENLSLGALLKNDFGIALPPLPSDEDLVPSAYAASVAAAVAGRPNWAVDADAIALGFFSFAKFLMYRDLDAATWPTPASLLENAALAGLLRDGFAVDGAPIPRDAHLDALIPAEKLDHVIDADGSQTLAIENVRRDRSLVIQGPPGTGKSQSITNIIATAVLDGKKVLFVAEKLAALEVVKRRLETLGLGDLCLELHSNKANKRAVLQEIGRTWRLGAPVTRQGRRVVEDLERTRARLNEHAAMMHERLEPSGETPYRIVGALAALAGRGRTLGDVALDAATRWAPDAVRERRAALADLAGRAESMGTPARHLWFGCARESVLAIDLPRIREALERLRASVASVRAEGATLAATLERPAARHLGDVVALCGLAAFLADAPDVDRAAMTRDMWRASLATIEKFATHGERYAELRTQLGALVPDEALDVDLTGVRVEVAGYGRSLFRFLRGPYRRALATLRGVLRGPLPASYDERVALLDAMIEARRTRAAVTERTDVLADAFGARWKGLGSDWALLRAIVAWAARGEREKVPREAYATFARLGADADLRAAGHALQSAANAALHDASAVAGELALDLRAAFGCGHAREIPFDALDDRLAQWLARLEDLTTWNAWFVRARAARQLDLAALVDGLEDGRLPPAEARDAFDRAYYSALFRAATARLPPLARFDGMEHERILAEFQRVDRQRLQLARQRVLDVHHAAFPEQRAGAGGTGVLLAELERKRGHRPIRRLLKDAGTVVQAIKPVFMMSPLSVAQFLEPGALAFDLLLIDEASQVQPVDAFGAFARARRHVVVGDSKQLPPTSFFARMTGNDEETEYDDEAEEFAEPQAAAARDLESILALCSARGLPSEMLRWHYRSRHHSLIAVSNREFYGNELFIVPSPHTAAAGLGLEFTHVRGGVYDRGKSRTNRVEAQAVCEAILAHARATPHQTLGVAAFSSAQQAAILDLLELERRRSPETEDFFHAHPHEPFFVKNLESVQGDERDVIFISVGYGPDAAGRMTMNFGPLGGEGGERRLNVLISRAKRRCRVFASFRSDAIDTSRVRARGIAAFKTFLHFAESGAFPTAEASGADPESPFEEAVRRAVEGLGFTVHPQVGVAGFFVDLGVVDPDEPGRYILGIECDGASYHASRSARDRDRLRQAILENQGWTIHRIWSTDWLQRPEEQLRRVADAIAAARAERAEAEAMAAAAAAAPPPAPTPAADADAAPAEPQREESVGAEAAPPPSLSVPYVEARVRVPANSAPHEVTPTVMAEVLWEIVQVEAPIHRQELLARARDAWRLGRAGSRVQAAVARGIEVLVAARRATLEEECLLVPGAPTPVRDRADARSTSLRSVELLPPPEVRAAIVAVVVAYHGTREDELATQVARLLGFKSTSAALRRAIVEQATACVAAGRVTLAGDTYRPASAATA